MKEDGDWACERLYIAINVVLVNSQRVKLSLNDLLGGLNSIMFFSYLDWYSSNIKFDHAPIKHLIHLMMDNEMDTHYLEEEDS